MTIKLWSILGNSQKLDGGAMFGNAPKAMWSFWLKPDADNRLQFACRALLATGLGANGDKRVLFETGIGAFFEPKLKRRYGVVEDEHVLLNSLDKAGFTADDIDAVVLSHLHFDHAGGLLAPWQAGVAPKLLFSKAKFIVGRECWERALKPHPRDRASFIPELPALLQASGRLEIIDGDHSPTLGSHVQFEYSHGHTPGLLLATISGNSGQGGVTFCADLIPGRPWVHVPITMGYDRYPELLIDEKQRFLDDKLARGVRLYFTHDAECAMASVTLNSDQRYMATDAVAELNGLVLA
jgi:glyoxylase-like metal-dependent hydrolase (beta-lactamase superfamily II)